MFINQSLMTVYFSMPQKTQEKYKQYLQRKDILIRGGLLIKQENNLLTIRCNKGHEFTSLPYVNNLNNWCPKCRKEKRGKTKIIWDRQLKAKQKAILKLQNKKSKKNKKYYNWIMEPKVRSLLEAKFKCILNKYRIYYTNNKHKFYEFDGYNEEHKIAFEYHGYQHYVYPNRFHKTEEQFKSACQRDRNKVLYCREKGIKLIIVPYTVKDLDSYIQHMEL